MGKLINRIPGSRLLTSRLPGPALEQMLNRSASFVMSTSILKTLPGKLDYSLYIVHSSTQGQSCLDLQSELFMV